IPAPPSPMPGAPAAPCPSCEDIFCGGCTPCVPGFGCQDCPDRQRLWFSAEYLLWWTSSTSVPPLVSASPVAVVGGIPVAAGGGMVESGPRARVVFGNGSLFPESMGGARFSAGWWFDPCRQRWGIDGSFFFLAQRSVDFAAV